MQVLEGIQQPLLPQRSTEQHLTRPTPDMDSRAPQSCVCCTQRAVASMLCCKAGHLHARAARQHSHAPFAATRDRAPHVLQGETRCVFCTGLDDVYRIKSPARCMRSQSFWLLMFINGVGTGAGLTLLNNLGQQVSSLLTQSCSCR